MAPPSLQQIREIIGGRREELARDYGVAAIGVFGSWARVILRHAVLSKKKCYTSPSARQAL